jgi:hypothetical protein
MGKRKHTGLEPSLVAPAESSGYFQGTTGENRRKDLYHRDKYVPRSVAGWQQPPGTN